VLSAVSFTPTPPSPIEGTSRGRALKKDQTAPAAIDNAKNRVNTAVVERALLHVQYRLLSMSCRALRSGSVGIRKRPRRNGAPAASGPAMVCALEMGADFRRDTDCDRLWGTEPVAVALGGRRSQADNRSQIFLAASDG
jgi:hypothetical protein